MTRDKHTRPTTDTDASRRRVLRVASAAAIGGPVLGAVSGTTAAQGDEIKEIDLRGGVPPVSDGPQGRDEVVFHIHGYYQSGYSVAEARRFQETARSLGYGGTVAAITWDDGAGSSGAREAGGKLANWLGDFRAENPGTTIRLLGYSMGGIVAMETVGAIDGDFEIANADMIASYERSDAPCRGSGFFDAIESSCTGMYNYWSANDGIARLGSSGGASCSDTPSNYTDVDVSDSVGGHSDYKESPGCVRKILENHEDGGGGGDPLSVATGAATDVGQNRATLTGELESLGDASSAQVAVQYRAAGGSDWNVTDSQQLTSPGEFSATVTGLPAETEHEFRAVASTDSGSDAGNVATFTTGEDGGGGDRSPAIDTFDYDSTCYWRCYVDVDWAVSDPDGDLATVEVELYGESGRLLDVAERSVSGSSASGSDRVRSGWFDDPDRLVLRVTDEAGNTTTEESG